jgi:hypothetical protein
MQKSFVKARIIDATQGRVLFAVDKPDGSSLAYDIGYADACRFAGRLLNAADYHARRGHTLSMLTTMNNQKATGCVGALIHNGSLTIGQADRLLKQRSNKLDAHSAQDARALACDMLNGKLVA